MTQDLIQHLAQRLRAQLGIVHLQVLAPGQALHSALSTLPAHHAALQLQRVVWQPTAGLRHRAHIQFSISLAEQPQSAADAASAGTATQLLTALAGYSYAHESARPDQRYYAHTPLRLRSSAHRQHGAQRHYTASFTTEYTLVLPVGV